VAVWGGLGLAALLVSTTLPRGVPCVPERYRGGAGVSDIHTVGRRIRPHSQLCGVRHGDAVHLRGVPAIAEAGKGLSVWAGLSAVATLAAEVAAYREIWAGERVNVDSHPTGYDPIGEGLIAAIVTRSVLAVVFIAAAWFLPRRQPWGVMAALRDWW
jgi:hypothetical protein